MIKNVVLDFGGVLLDLNYSKTDEAFKQLFELSFDGRNYPPQFQRIFDEYEKGSFGEGSFFHRLQRLSPRIITENSLERAWNAMLLGIPQSSLDLVQELMQSYTVILLSNTNHTHIQWVKRYLKREYNLDTWPESHFDKVYYSYKIKMRKPESEIYQYVLQDARILPEQTLFVDDSEINLAAPQKLGIQCVLHNPHKAHISTVIYDYIKEAES